MKKMRIEEVREEVKRAVKAKEPILLYGKSGVGKTSVVYDVAHELNMSVSEINSSLCRDTVSYTHLTLPTTERV